MKIGSLFSGIGGLELGLEWAGVGETRWQVELDDGCRAVLQEHWPDADRFPDVHAVGRHNLRRVDLICGGFPCQDVSLAGEGAGLTGARSGLWGQFSRIVGELRPRFVLVENVAGGARRWLPQVRADLRGHGYHTRAFNLAAAECGAGHLRRRIFVVAYLDGNALRVEPGRGGGTRRAEAALIAGGGEAGADADRLRQHEPEGRIADERGRAADGGGAEPLADAPRGRRLQGARGVGQEGGRTEPDHGGEALADAARERIQGVRPGGVEVSDPPTESRLPRRDGGRSGEGRPDRKPRRRVVRAVHGLPAWMDRRFPAALEAEQFPWEAPRLEVRSKGDAQRIKALGNAVMPAQAFVIGKLVLELAAARAS